MTIIENETNLRESRVLQSISIPDANAEEDLRVLYQIFDPREESCESCKYPVFVAVDIGIFGGVQCSYGRSCNLRHGEARLCIQRRADIDIQFGLRLLSMGLLPRSEVLSVLESY